MDLHAIGGGFFASQGNDGCGQLLQLLDVRLLQLAPKRIGEAPTRRSTEQRVKGLPLGAAGWRRLGCVLWSLDLHGPDRRQKRCPAGK